MLGSRLWDRHRDAKRQREAAAAAEATAQQLSSSLQQQQQEGIDVEILQAFLDGASWADSLDQFFTGNCPAFSSFVVGGEYALQQTELHMKFVSTAEALLDSKLKQMAVSADDFLARVLRDIAEAGPGSASAAASTAVMQRLEECADFERFGEMMRQRYEDTMQDSGGGKGSGEEADGDAAEEQEDAAAAVAAVGAAGGGAEEDFAREQREIREAMARRKSAREQATQRAAAAAAELDAADAAADHADEAAGAEEGVHGASSLEPELTGPWEMGSVHRGVVTFWENGQRSWGAKVGGYGMILKMGKPEIYVHNTALPMGARRRWLRRGEKVEFTVAPGPHGHGPQATRVVGVGPAGESPAPLLCQVSKGFKVKVALDEATGRFKLNIGLAQGYVEPDCMGI